LLRISVNISAVSANSDQRRAIQGAGAITGGLTLTNPVGFTIRALIALAAEAVLAVITIACLRRRSTLRPAVPRRAGDWWQA
jgi:hypothetical protein